MQPYTSIRVYLLRAWNNSPLYIVLSIFQRITQRRWQWPDLQMSSGLRNSYRTGRERVISHTDNEGEMWGKKTWKRRSEGRRVSRGGEQEGESEICMSSCGWLMAFSESFSWCVQASQCVCVYLLCYILLLKHGTCAHTHTYWTLRLWSSDWDCSVYVLISLVLNTRDKRDQAATPADDGCTRRECNSP